MPMCVALSLPLRPSDLTMALSLLQLTAKNGGKGKPEYRIPALVFGSLFVPVGIL